MRGSLYLRKALAAVGAIALLAGLAMFSRVEPSRAQSLAGIQQSEGGSGVCGNSGDLLYNNAGVCGGIRRTFGSTGLNVSLSTQFSPTDGCVEYTNGNGDLATNTALPCFSMTTPEITNRIFATDAGTANAISASTVDFTNTNNGLNILVLKNVTNTGAVTMDLNGSGAVPVVAADGTTPLTAGQMVAGRFYQCVFQTNHFALLNPTLATVSAHHMVYVTFFGQVFTNGTTNYAGVGASGSTTTTEINSWVDAPEAATLSNFCISTHAAQPSTSTYVFNVRKNQVNTGITVTLSPLAAGGQYCDNTHSAAVVVGDHLTIQVVATGTTTGTAMNGTTLLQN